MNRTGFGVVVLVTGLVASLSTISAQTGVAAGAVAGPSALHRLGLSLARSAMGSTGSWGAEPHLPPSFVPSAIVNGNQVTLTGADIYRLSCRACHRADGTGAPEEIRSLIDPVRSTSATVMQRRMKDQGRPVSWAFAVELSRGSRDDVLNQVLRGGDKMPAFGHLTRAEFAAVFAYLELLAGVPGAEARQRRVTMPTTRVGEHLVRGTCHVCHDATGPWPDSAAQFQGAIPSLAAIARLRGAQSITRKVRYGAPLTSGNGESYRGRMPTFGYLTDSQIAAAYAYLVTYPPQPAQ